MSARYMYSKSTCANYVYTMMLMLHAVLLVVAHDLLEYRYVDDVMGNLFFLFCSTFTVLIMFVRLCQAKASESLKKKKP